MVDLAAVVLILGAALGTLFLSVRASLRSDRYAYAIMSGTNRGIAMSVEHRWHWVYTLWLPVIAIEFSMPLVTGLAMLEIAEVASGEGIRVLAYAWAGLAFSGSFLVVAVSTSGFFTFRSILLRAKNED